jgi:hypothetical protein
MKKIIIGSILVIGLATGYAYAHGNGWGGGYGGHMMGNGGHMMGYSGHMMGYGGQGMMGNNGDYTNCPGAAYFGENGWNSKGHQKFLDDTVNLRKELSNKRFEYQEAYRNPNTTKEQLASIEDKIIDIEKQLQSKAQQY